MKTDKIKDRAEYEEIMNRIERSLQRLTKLGGIEHLSAKEIKILQELSLIAEQYEDNIPLMPIKAPKTLAEMIRYKMFEMNIRQN